MCVYLLKIIFCTEQALLLTGYIALSSQPLTSILAPSAASILSEHTLPSEQNNITLQAQTKNVLIFPNTRKYNFPLSFFFLFLLNSAAV